MPILSIIIGIIIVSISLILIRKEFQKSLNLKISKLGRFSGDEQRQIIEILETLENDINELNEAFYSIVNDLEGKYSIHEKQIDLLENRLMSLESRKDIVKETHLDLENIELELENENDLVSKALKMREEGQNLNSIAKDLGVGVEELKLLLKFKRNN